MMTFQHIPDDRRTNGSSYAGEIRTTFNDLRRVFGEPNGNGSDKSRIEWVLEFSDGTIATIYDYKQTIPLERVEVWNIGGFSDRAATLVADALGIRVGRYF